MNNHPDQQAIDQMKKGKNLAQAALQEKQSQEKLGGTPKNAQKNSTCGYKTVEEEFLARNEIATNQIKIIRSQLPGLLKQLSKIKDPRNPKKSKYKLTVLMIYGIFMFVFNMTSRREADREMTMPVFLENLHIFFPEIEKLPHNDTLMRLLTKIEAGQIERSLITSIQKLIRNKKFARYLINGHYPIAIDGTQKMIRDYIWSEQCQERTVGKNDQKRKQYYVYVLEASLAFQNGMTIPLMSEFLSYTEGDTERKKQDCETKAFKRLARRLKSTFKRLPIILLLDGLYANGPVMEICHDNRWDYMIVLKDDSLTTVWREYDALQSLESHNVFKMKWGNREQSFNWINDIEYEYDRGKIQLLHVVVCIEVWEEVDNKSNEIITRTSKHAWISRKSLNKQVIHDRCNLAARHRWNIESEILTQKHHGYQYEHCFSYNWNAMKGYHYLMRIGLMLNVLVQYSERFIEVIKAFGKRGTIKFVFETLKGPWLDTDYVKRKLETPAQLRLI
jgi:DDE family transposase